MKSGAGDTNQYAGSEARFWGMALVTAFYIVMIMSLGFVVAMLAAGLWELAKAIYMFGWTMAPETSTLPYDADTPRFGADSSIGLTIRALEMFIIAPLPCIVLQGMANHLNQYAGVSKKALVLAEASLPKVKATMANILVSIVAVNLVGRVLNKDPLDWETAGSLLLIIVVLTAYYFAMDYSARMVTKKFDASTNTSPCPEPKNLST